MADSAPDVGEHAANFRSFRLGLPLCAKIPFIGGEEGVLGLFSPLSPLHFLLEVKICAEKNLYKSLIRHDCNTIIVSIITQYYVNLKMYYLNMINIVIKYLDKESLKF